MTSVGFVLNRMWYLLKAVRDCHPEEVLVDADAIVSILLSVQLRILFENELEFCSVIVWSAN